MHTLEQLLSGELKGTKTLKLSCQLTHFPDEIINLADSLEILDLSGNQLSELPKDFSKLNKLKIAFFSDNHFSKFPEVLAECSNLTMIGFKSNQIHIIPEHAFPVNLQWLILTNNKINHLPNSIGNCTRLQKVALAGNQIRQLPEQMKACKNLELLRISANQLTEFPDWLLALPRLSWLAFSGNPCCTSTTITNELPSISWNNLIIQELLGQGASGMISKARWTNHHENKEIAVKVFKGEVTSDGFPEDEMKACIIAGAHNHLVRVIGKIQDHPEQKMGLALDLISKNYKNLGNPPSFDTCTRDTFNPNTIFETHTILQVVKAIADASQHIHSKGIMHGDLYAHNILYDDCGHTIFGDFGAATIYGITHKQANLFEKIDVRAFGCLLDDLLSHSENKHSNADLLILKNQCMSPKIEERPTFADIVEYINAISSKN
jgi:hypothetical protein